MAKKRKEKAQGEQPAPDATEDSGAEGQAPASPAAAVSADSKPKKKAKPEPAIARSGPVMVVLKAPENVCSISSDDGGEPIAIPESRLVEVTDERARVLINQGFEVHNG